jgi:hypothetical protein
MLKQHKGSCHCGTVQFEAELDADAHAGRCNCSVCTKIGAPTQIVKPVAFRLLEGAGSLTPYIWGGKISTRYFCKRCGVHCYGAGYLEEVGGDYVSINLNTLDDIDPGLLTVQHWDGRHNNWEAGPRNSPYPIQAEAAVKLA